MISPALKMNPRLGSRFPSVWKRASAAVLLLVLTLAGATTVHMLSLRMNRLSALRTLEPFRVTDLDGRTLELGGRSSKKAAYFFFLPSCSHCQVELSHPDNLSRFNSPDFGIYAISTADRQQTVTFAQRQQDHSLFVAAPDTASRLGLLRFPVLLLVQADGAISTVEEGERTPQYRDLLLSRFRDGLPVDGRTMKMLTTELDHH